MAKYLIYLLGASRSGSSALESYLQSNYDYLALGEVRWAFERGFRDNDTCGCGEPVNDCNFWGKFEISSEIQEQLLQGRKHYDLPKIIQPLKKISSNAKSVYKKNVKKIYIEAFKHSDVIIDNSKRPEYLNLIQELLSDEDIEFLIIPVIRNPMGNIKSWSTHKRTQESSVRLEMNRYNPITAGIFYTYYNLNIIYRKITKNDLSKPFDPGFEYEFEHILKKTISNDENGYHPISGNPDNLTRRERTLRKIRARFYIYGLPFLPIYWLARWICK